MASAKRSPLKDRPLHNPGLSVDEELFDLLFDKLLTPAMLALFLCLLAGLGTDVGRRKARKLSSFAFYPGVTRGMRSVDVVL